MGRAVLVAISIPIFTSQLEKSRDAVTVSNIRAAYAEASTAYLTSNGQAVGNTGDHVTVAAPDTTDGSVTVTVHNVVAKGQQDGFSNLDSELPFIKVTGTNIAGMGNGKNGKNGTGEFDVMFKYAKNSDSEPVVTCTASTN